MPDSKRNNSSQNPRLEQKLLLTKTERFYLTILELPYHILREKYLPVVEIDDTYHAYSEDLHEVLIKLLAYLGLSDQEEKVAEYIIYNIDSAGKLRITPQELAEKFNIEVQQAKELIDLIFTEFAEEIQQHTVNENLMYIEPDIIMTPEKVEVRKIEVKDPIITRALQMREETLLKICEEIRKVNEYFLRGYRKYPQIFTMRYMARLLGVHVSTISRAVRNKYISTPLGILPLRFFFWQNTQQKNCVARNRKTAQVGQ
ncbi:RNA polymerase subunit sigma-54 [Fervidobacterium pennivorans subsp. shakshaketiis]